MSDIIEKIEKKANNEGWYYRKIHPSQACVRCYKEIEKGFVMAPGLNYPLCLQCAEIEFK